MSREERQGLTAGLSRDSQTSPPPGGYGDDAGAALARTSTADRLNRQNSRQRARMATRMANHPLEQRSSQSLRNNCAVSLIAVIQWLAILSALISDGWSATYCGKPLALWLEVHAAILAYDLVPVWAPFVLPVDSVARLNSALAGLKCLSAVFRLAWVIVGTDWVFTACEEPGGETVRTVAQVIVITTWVILGVTCFCCCCCLPALLLMAIANDPDEFIARLAANQPGHVPAADSETVVKVVKGTHFQGGAGAGGATMGRHRIAVPSLGWERTIDPADAVDVISQMEYEPGEEIAVLGCGHHYAYDGLMTWLATKGSCPSCRSTDLVFGPDTPGWATGASVGVPADSIV
eukprot:SAG22_NODE_484_length_9912_cov_23.425150_3_plen_349_part_00